MKSTAATREELLLAEKYYEAQIAKRAATSAKYRHLGVSEAADINERFIARDRAKLAEIKARLLALK